MSTHTVTCTIQRIEGTLLEVTEFAGLQRFLVGGVWVRSVTDDPTGSGFHEFQLASQAVQPRIGTTYTIEVEDPEEPA
jgi:hypothetical protein